MQFVWGQSNIDLSTKPDNANKIIWQLQENSSKTCWWKHFFRTCVTRLLQIVNRWESHNQQFNIVMAQPHFGIVWLKFKLNVVNFKQQVVPLQVYEQPKIPKKGRLLARWISGIRRCIGMSGIRKVRSAMSTLYKGKVRYANFGQVWPGPRNKIEWGVVYWMPCGQYIYHICWKGFFIQ